MKCRAGCGVCCIAPSISQPLPYMPDGKPAGQACANLDLESYSAASGVNPNIHRFVVVFNQISTFVVLIVKMPRKYSHYWNLPLILITNSKGNDSMYFINLQELS